MRMLHCLPLALSISVPLAAHAAGVDDALAAVQPLAIDTSFALFVACAPGDPSRLFVVERPGRIRVVEDGTLRPTPFLDITNLVGCCAGETGLLGLAFDADYPSNGRFYLNYTNLEGHTEIVRFTVSPDPAVADPGSYTLLLTIEQLSSIHNGGWIGFGPDGFLYVCMGDGGSASGPTGATAQDLNSLLGKILRIDVNGAEPYSIPPTNPFATGGGRPEIWAYGVRNPWRASFDRLTGNFWFGDVGVNAREEINLQSASSRGGENYGWRCMEGSICIDPPLGCNCDAPELVPPHFEVAHPNACAIIGGYVYRGAALPELWGHYIFGDLCTSRVWALDPRTMNASLLLSAPGGSLLSFSEDADGELLVLTSTTIGRIVPNVPSIIDCNHNRVEDADDIARGTSADANGDGIPDECTAAGDLNGSGQVNAADLALLLGSWGACLPSPPGSGTGGEGGCIADLNTDGVVNAADLAMLLGAWTLP